MRTASTRKPLPAAALLALLAVSCSGLTPAGFWKNFKHDLVADHYSDQGPWGGTRWIQWQAKEAGTLTVADAVRFAGDNGWSCRSPVGYSADQLQVWQYGSKPVLALPFGPADKPPSDWRVARLPRAIDEDSVVIACDSGWIRVEPGTNESSPALGYIHINASGTRMAIYHVWGEI